MASRCEVLALAQPLGASGGGGQVALVQTELRRHGGPRCPDSGSESSQSSVLVGLLQPDDGDPHHVRHLPQPVVHSVQVNSLIADQNLKSNREKVERTNYSYF